MKKESGITLISLVITVIVVAILASIATYSGINIINSSKLTVFTTELKIMQSQINNIYQDDNNVNLGDEITGTIKEQADIVFAELANDTKTGITSQEGYKYWSNELIKELGIEGVEKDFFVNIQQRSIVSYEGLKYEGKMYYTLSQLPNEMYNVTYENPNSGKPTFKVTVTQQGTSKWKIEIFDIKYDEGYIDKWQVNYKLRGKSYWNISEDLSFVVNDKGFYDIKK